MRFDSFIAGSWHVIRLPSASPDQRGRLYGFYHALMASYAAAGAPTEFEVYRSLGSRSLYAYLSPQATALTAGGLRGKGYKLVPLRREFNVATLPVDNLEQVLPRA